MNSITTTEELDALVVGTVLRSNAGSVWVVDHDETDGTELRYNGNDSSYFTATSLLTLHGPLAVIYDPVPQSRVSGLAEPGFTAGDRVVVRNTMLFNGRTGMLMPPSDAPEDFWDFNVLLDGTQEDPSRTIGVTRDQIARAQSEENVYLEKFTIEHAYFGGIGGDVAKLTITREAWRDLGQAEELTVTVAASSRETEDDADLEAQELRA